MLAPQRIELGVGSVPQGRRLGVPDPQVAISRRTHYQRILERRHARDFALVERKVVLRHQRAGQ